MATDDEIQRQIELKRLEIEKLKLELEVSQVNIKGSTPTIDKQFPDYVGWNVFLLLGICVVFYAVSWVSLDANVQTSSGFNQSYFFNGWTGFDMGKVSFTYPSILLNFILLIFIIRNDLRIVGILAFLGLCISIYAVYYTGLIDSSGASFSSPFGSISANYKVNAFCLAPPLLYLILFFSNIFTGKIKVKNSLKTDEENLEAVQGDEEIDQAKIAEQELLLAEKKLKDKAENSKHYRDDIKYLRSTKIELACLISLLPMSYFLIKLNDDSNPVLVPVFSICIIICVALLLENIFVLYLLAETFIKTSFKAVVFKLCFYSVFFITVLTYLFNQLFLNYDVILPVESYLIVGYLSLLTIILITVINEKRAIRLNVNSNVEKL